MFDTTSLDATSNDFNSQGSVVDGLSLKDFNSPKVVTTRFCSKECAKDFNSTSVIPKARPAVGSAEFVISFNAANSALEGDMSSKSQVAPTSLEQSPAPALQPRG
eukprot:6617392-Karenia_brevis.AAC.1